MKTVERYITGKRPFTGPPPNAKKRKKNECSPPMLTQLKPIQEHAVEWIRQREDPNNAVRGGIFAYDMGDGKTRALLEIIASDTEGPTLVVCEKSNIYIWLQEIRRHIGTTSSFHVLVFHQELIEAEVFSSLTASHLQNYQLILTTYDCIYGGFAGTPLGIYEKKLKWTNKNDYESLATKYHDLLNDATGATTSPILSTATATGYGLLFSIAWQRMIIDEGHFIRNLGCKARALLRIHAEKRWFVSGTPIQNKIDDIYSAFLFLRIFYEDGNFPLPYQWARFRRTIERSRQQRDISLFPTLLTREEKIMQRWIRIYVLLSNHKLKEKLPALKKYVIKRPFQLELERLRCSDSLIRLDTVTKMIVNSGGRANMEARKTMLTSLMRIRQISAGLAITGEYDALHSTKMKMFEEYMCSHGDRVLAFSEWVEVLQLAAQKLDTMRISWCMLHGGMSSSERNNAISNFKTATGPRVFLMSKRAAATGLNLVEARRVLFFEPHWNPQLDRQAFKRPHRIGQKQEVIVTWLIICGCEARIHKLSQGKLEIADAALRGDIGGAISIPKISLTSASTLRATFELDRLTNLSEDKDVKTIPDFECMDEEIEGQLLQTLSDRERDFVTAVKRCTQTCKYIYDVTKIIQEPCLEDTVNSIARICPESSAFAAHNSNHIKWKLNYTPRILDFRCPRKLQNQFKQLIHDFEDIIGALDLSTSCTITLLAIQFSKYAAHLNFDGWLHYEFPDDDDDIPVPLVKLWNWKHYIHELVV